MNVERLASLPNWPARMGEDLAAAYMGVSLTTFRERVQGRAYPQPVWEGRRKLFARVQLDRFVAAQFSLAADNDEEGSGWAS